MDLLRYLNDTNFVSEEIKKLNAYKRTLDKEAYESHIFEVEVKALVTELEKALKTKDEPFEITTYFEPYDLPRYIETKEVALEYIEKHHPQFIVHFYTRQMFGGGTFSQSISFTINSSTKTSDGKKVFDHIKFPASSKFGKIEAFIPREIQDGLLLNLNPAADYFNSNKVLTTAIINCVKNREKLKKSPKNREKQ